MHKHAFIPIPKELPDEIRKAYIQVRREYEERITGLPSTYSTGLAAPSPITSTGRRVNRRSVWDRLAERSPEINPFIIGRYIRAQFDPLFQLPPPPPTSLIGPRAEARYYQALEGFRYNIRRSLLMARDVFNREVTRREIMFSKETEQEAIVATLRQEHVAMPAIYRYCIARRLGLEREAKHFQAAAMVDTEGLESEYERIWGEFFVSPRGNGSRPGQ